ncbi:uncharacterized protein LOC107791569 [Nicotiana tabacum]|uniref:Uncharacterized protein LOC107791569 n=1 Tax=Nicotiana tabacum TaxID=4097 RepID=A0A1S3ZXL6_TOBAC|nr:PREDICTED: uncharacterized protein LOC107791569 [Nicotiana tabacum]
MDFPEINMISDFEAGVKCLQNPSLISRFFSLSEVTQIYGFWKWGALIIAVVATFSSLIRKIKLLFVYVFTLKPSAEPLLQYLGEDFDISDSDDEDDKCSTPPSSDDEDLIDRQIDEDFRVSGSSFYFKEQGQNHNLRLRRQRNSFERFPWTEFSAGKNVVKLWDSLALGLDYEYDDLSKSVVSLWDLNAEQKISDIFSGSSQVPAVATASPSVVLSSEVKNDRNGVVLAAYDTRMKSQSPAICAEWRKGSGKVVGVNAADAGKLYLKNKAAGFLTVGDLRNVKSPLVITEGDDDTWWDADAVIIEEKFDGSN